MKKYTSVVVVIFCALMLTACASTPTEPQSTVRLVQSTTYPFLPDIKPVPEPDLVPWSHDVPRDTSKLSVIESEKCTSVPETKRDKTFWRECGINPPLDNSNIFIGFDQDNWNIIIENFAKLRETIYQYKTRIDEVNQQRKEWREKSTTENNPQQ